MDPYAPEGILPNVLRWEDRLGQIVRNLASGKGGSAGRHALDFLGELVDAPLPGDWIPAATGRNDYVSGSELVGGGGALADIGVGILTDPLTYLSFGTARAMNPGQAARYTVEAGLPFTGGRARATLGTFDKPMDPLSLAARGADTGISKVLGKLDEKLGSKTRAGAQDEGYSKGYSRFKAWMRRAAGAEDLSPEVRQKLQEAAAEGSAASKVWTTQAEEAIKGLDTEERVLLAQAMHGIDIGSLRPKKGSQATALTGDIMANVQALSRKYGKDINKLQGAAAKIQEMGQRQYDELVGKQAFYKAPGQNQAYLQRQWYLPDEAGFTGSSPAAAQNERKLYTPQDVVSFLNKGNTGLELDAGRLLLNRAQQQGKMLGQTKLAKEFAPGSTDTLSEGLRSEAAKNIEASTLNADEKYALKNMLEGMPARGPVTDILAKLSKPVKGAMVYGVVLPKFGSILRNKLGMGFQAAATPGAREEALTHLNPINVFREMGKAWDEAYGTAIFGKADDLSKDMALLDDAYKSAKQTDDVQSFLKNAGRPDLADAVRNGVLDGFVSTEEIISKAGRSPGWEKFWDIYHAPGRMFQALEQRGRLQTYKNLLKRTNDPNKAAALTKDALYDYNINSPENRALRDVLPFAQFMVKSIPQQAKWLSQRPAVAAGAAPLFYDPSGDEGPVYPYMQGRSRIGVGEDTSGNQLYLTGFGLPMESIDVLPNLSGGLRESGRDVAQGLLSSTQPLLKTAGAWATGRDPFFGTPFGSYDKIPVVGEAGGIGRAYNIAAGTGILEPVGGGILRQIGQLTDEKKPLGTRIADITTGAKLVSVDPDIAQQRVITEYLEERPDIQQYRTFYKQGEQDQEFASLMAELRAAKARSKAKREEAASAGL